MPKSNLEITQPINTHLGTLINVFVSTMLLSSFLHAQSPQPDYQIPYGKIKPEDVKLTLDRVLTYLEQVTPATIINSKTGQPVTYKTKPIKEAALAKGDFRITTHEWGVVYTGMLRASETTGDQKFKTYVADRFKFISEASSYFREYEKEFPDENNPMRNVLEPHSLDDAGSLCASMIKGLQLDIQADLRPIVDNSMSFIMTKAHRTADGTFARNKPLPNSIWLDDLYQSIPALAQMGKLTGEKKYYDEAVRQIMNYADRMFSKEKGIYMHGWVEGMEAYPAFHWARANGWALMAKTALLEVLPENHPGRTAVIELFRSHLRGLASYQSGNGLWHQLLDRSDSYTETSASAMYAYCIAHAINNGWIDVQAYGPMALLAWTAISVKVTEKGQVEGTCVGTGLAFDAAFYYNRPVSASGPHGYGPVLLSGAEMFKLLKEHVYESNGAVIFVK